MPSCAHCPTRTRSGALHYCARCHGPDVESSGLVPDLRYATSETHEGIEGIVLGGARQALGMPSFAADLDVDQVRAIQAYILERASQSAGR